MMKLSIIVLSSGREETIEKCLSSVASFKKQLPVEIIVVDTDASHNPFVADIVRQYADKIIEFEWQDDFSMARNAGVNVASGEWVFCIDDDEWLFSVKPIVEFLKSSEQYKHNWANIQVRNYHDADLDTWDDTWVTRLYELREGSHYEGAVHEHFVPISGKPAIIHATIGHTGYIYKSDEKLMEKTVRNVSLLEKEIFRNPLEIRWWVQHVAEYDIKEHRFMVESLCEKYLKKSKLIPITSQNKRYVTNMIGSLLITLLKSKVLNDDFDSARVAWIQYFRMCEWGLLPTAALMLYGAVINNHYKEYYQAKECCREYVELYKEYLNNPDEYVEDLTYTLDETFSKQNQFVIMTILRAGYAKATENERRKQKESV